MNHALALISVIGLLTVGLAGVAIGSQDIPAQSAMSDELTANETATLWSKEPNECSLEDDTDADSTTEGANDADETTDGEETQLTAIEELGRCTDLTFKEPPDTADRWTSSVHDSMAMGDAETSIYPEHASLTNSVQIADAHATMFSVQPSTRTHINESTTTHYIAQEGTVRGVVDYRLRLPSDTTASDHEIDEVRLLRDGEVVSTVDGTQTPVLDYAFEEGGEATLTLEADIHTTVEQTVEEERTRQTDSVTVAHDIDVELYDLQASVYYASYPDGDDGVAIYQSQPWHGYTLTDERETSVRGVWRYYTGRDTNWDELTHANATSTETKASPDRPVYVHAYPSEMGPRSEPIRDGPEILDVWGRIETSPAPTINEHVEIEVVSNLYTRSDGVALRYESIDREAITVTGIVHGTTATLSEPEGDAHREVRASDLSLHIVESTATTATVRVELRDAETGAPIMLETPFELDRFSLISLEDTEEYVYIDGERVQTDALGTAEVTLTQPGIHSARYDPGSWRTHDPAYLGDTASLTWHPLGTVTGWMTLLVDIIRYGIPVLVALYAAKRLGAFLKIEDSL